MAKRRCPECGESVTVEHSFCPSCGCKAGSIQKAAAGLEALVTLGDVVHESGSIAPKGQRTSQLCDQFRSDCRDRDYLDWLHDVRAGDTNMMCIIGHAYWSKKRGLVRQDLDLARQWFELAMAHGDRSGSEALEMMDEELDAPKSGCFLTTAVTEAMHLPDDCLELKTLRGFRDTYMAKSPFLQAERLEYYRIAPSLVERIRRRSNSLAIWHDLAFRLIQPAVALIHAGQNEAAHLHYRAMMTELLDRFPADPAD